MIHIRWNYENITLVGVFNKQLYLWLFGINVNCDEIKGNSFVFWPRVSRETNLLAKLVYIRRQWLYLWYKMTCSLTSYLQIRQYGMTSTLNYLIFYDLYNNWCPEESILHSTETLRLKDTRRQVLVFHIFQLANQWLK